MKREILVVSLVFLFTSCIIPVTQVKALDGYDSLGYVYDTYQVSSSADDAFLTVGSQFNSDWDYVPVKHSYLDTIIGLRFENVSIPDNSTHFGAVRAVYLSLYSDSATYIPEPCLVTGYYCDEYNGSSFSSYSDLLNRAVRANPFSIDCYDLHAVSGVGQWVNSSNFYGQSIGVIPDAPSAITFKILSTSGSGLRQARTFDYNSSLGAKLYVVYELFEATDIFGVFVEKYRGYEIYNNGEYENFYQDYTEVDPVGVLSVSESNPYRIDFDDLGFESCWNDPTYFIRDESLRKILNRMWNHPLFEHESIFTKCPMLSDTFRKEYIDIIPPDAKLPYKM